MKILQKFSTLIIGITIAIGIIILLIIPDLIKGEL